MEQTPPQLIRYTYETWKSRWLKKTATPRVKRSPGVWDPFAGSATGHDLLSGLLGCNVVSTDLTPCNEAVSTLDARALGSLYEHGGMTREHLRARLQGTDNAVVRTPDIVLLDPPSRGCPTPSELYASQWPERDIALLERDEWIATVSEIARKSLQRLAQHGLVSLLLRHGVRERQRIEPDDQLVNDVRSALGGGVEVLEEARIEYRGRVRQASLATMRVPSTHWLLWRP
jgi:hypothetical protein